MRVRESVGCVYSTFEQQRVSSPRRAWRPASRPAGSRPVARLATFCRQQLVAVQVTMLVTFIVDLQLSTSGSAVVVPSALRVVRHLVCWHLLAWPHGARGSATDGFIRLACNAALGA